MEELKSSKDKFKDNFITKAKIMHGDRYDYSLVNYVNSKTKVKIICKKHGIFEQTPSNHMKGSNCKLCANESSSQKQRLTKNEVIKKFRFVHGDKYDYSLMEYKKNDYKIKIICPEHGIFEQRPNNHMNGNGCPKCKGKILQMKNKGLENVIKDFRFVHGDKYDYSLVQYKHSRKKVKIICKKHGIFEQTPNNHTRGDKCPKCRGLYKNNQDMEKEFKKVHGDKYLYNLLDYKNHATKVKIICKKHGVFEQTPNNHIAGQGCKLCGKLIYFSKTEREIYEYMLKHFKVVHSQWKNKELLNNQHLDIFIEDVSVGVEVHGKQHFQAIKHFGGEDGFVRRKELDNKKYKVCKENGIKIFYFSYEKDIPNDFEHFVYNDKEKLLKDIKNWKKN